MSTITFDNDLDITPLKENHSENRIKYPWSNSDNSNFYASIQPSAMKSFAKKAGLSSCCDIALIENFWRKSESILEVGAGYGRVIQYLLAHNYTGTLSAIEQSPILYKYLAKHYSDSSKLLNIDVQQCHKISDTFDLILFAWSGIQDFSPTEQKFVILELAKLLNTNGTLIVDTIPSETVPLGTEACKIPGVHRLEFNDTAVYIYDVTDKKMKSYAKLAGFNKVSHTSYTTDSGRNRVFHIMSK